ncbi:MAG: hypothetical protein JWP67_1921 [Mucilaginibacter sp.]|nr:hypothetical protein [Mucilaginibacter sp.]
MATNQKDKSRDDQDQKGRGNNQEAGSSTQENQGNSNEHGGNSQETQGNSDDDSYNRGSVMDDDKQRGIASKAAHESGHGHEFGSKEARKAGRKRGLL